MSEKFQGYLYLSLAMILVGSTVIASKIIAAGFAPFTATAMRFAIAFPLFLLLMRLTKTQWPKLGSHDWMILIAQAGAGSVGYTTLLIAGLSLTSAANAGVVIGTLPVVSAAIAFLLLGERPDRRMLAAIALAAFGVLTIIFKPGDGGGHSALGIALIFGAVICEGLFILLNKRVKAEVSPLALSTLMAGLGFAVSLIPALFETHATEEIDQGAIVAVVYYALIPTVAGFLLWYAGSAKVSGTEASVFTALAPVSAVLFAFLLLDEPIGDHQLLGIGCVLAAVLGLTVPQIRAGRRTARALPTRRA
ncbi:DMT family transporter [Ensifer adhaerens]|uniref:DMT family transporter n=1 Tax=Ensifer adhaerens TaxID=106592 RepID=UPI0023A91DDB|nr:DMT family transporter [Ensifer adhaerens]WDZ76896.1 DMT family transporter [Ensifer adhaerens]